MAKGRTKGDKRLRMVRYWGCQKCGTVVTVPEHDVRFLTVREKWFPQCDCPVGESWIFLAEMEVEPAIAVCGLKETKQCQRSSDS